jgi:AraC-like DNA-binding protein
VTEPAVQRHHFRTGDPDVAYAHMSSLYAEHDMLLSGSVDQFHFNTDAVVADGLSVGHIEYSMAADVDVGGGVDSPLIMHQSAGGRLQLGHDRHTTTLGDGDLFLAAPHRTYSARWTEMDITAVGLSSQLLDEDAALLTGGEDGHVTFQMGPPLSPSTRGHWLHIQRFVAHNLTTNPQVAGSPLARRGLIRLLNGATLACFPNTTHHVEPDSGIGATPAPVRRAVAYIDEHADTVIDLADLCAAARLSPRALQAAFRRHLDTTPLGYLRRVRLDRTHRQLQAAQPGDGQTVATIATHWGFTQLGRFAHDYRIHFGTTPSQTLRATSE